MESSFKHSPAPWLINQNQHRLFIETPGGYPSLFDTYKLGDGVVIANLRLAAASPEMLDLIMELKRNIESAQSNFSDGDPVVADQLCDIALRKIHDLLSKLEGNV